MESSNGKSQNRIEELAGRADRLEMALEAANAAYWDQDFRTGEIYRSPLWAEMLGYRPEEIDNSKTTWLDMVHPNEREMVIKKAREHEKGVSPVFRVEHRLRTKQGDYKWILNWGKVVEWDEEGSPVRAMGIHMDISDRIKMEEEIIRSKKLKSIGILAGGIAHDFNNLLAVMLGNLSLIKAGGVRGDKMFELIDAVEKACMKSRDLTRELMTFTRNVDIVPETVSVKDIIRESCEFTLHGSNVECDIEIEPDISPIMADRSQVKRALYNIFLNARQAMPEGGTIRVKCSKAKISASDDLPLNPGEYVILRVEDRGEGIPFEIQDRIFDPFFTTRENGRGIGLAACHSIVKKHNGHIRVESEVGKGTEFYIYLPASEEEPAGEKTDEGSVITGSGRVLVVDDEPAIRKMAEQMLEALGYSADSASGGAQAIRLYRESLEQGCCYDAVILDLTIPGEKGGCDVLRRIRELDSGVRAIVSSGYSEDDAIANYQDYGFVHRLAKPYRIDKISRVLNSVIDSAD